jgi:hypothetical protein
VSGLLITALLFPVAGCIAGRRPLAEMFLFGVGVVGTALFVLGFFHVPFTVTIGIVLVAGLVRLAMEHQLQPVGPAKAGAPLAMIIIPLAILAISAAIVPLNDFDGRGFWVLKAKALAHERAIDGPFFHNAVVNDPRNQYPLLIPLDAAAVMIAAGDSDDRQVRWLYLFTFASLVFVVAQRINPWCGAILAWTPQFAVNPEGGALTAYCDIAIAAFAACAFLELMEGASPFRFGLWLTFLTLTKSEGLPIALILLAIGAMSFRHRIAISVAPLAIAVSALFFWRAQIPKTDEEDYFSLLITLPSNAGRLLPAIAETTKHFFFVSNWGLLWIAVWIALAILAWRREWRAPATVVAISALYITAYAITRWRMHDLIDASADRLLMHMIGPALFAIGRITDGSAQSRYGRPEYPPKSA